MLEKFKSKNKKSSKVIPPPWLQPDIIANVFSYLELNKILQLGGVCKSWQSCVPQDTSPIWQKTCEREGLERGGRETYKQTYLRFHKPHSSCFLAVISENFPEEKKFQWKFDKVSVSELFPTPGDAFRGTFINKKDKVPTLHEYSKFFIYELKISHFLYSELFKKGNKKGEILNVRVNSYSYLQPSKSSEFSPHIINPSNLYQKFKKLKEEIKKYLQAYRENQEKIEGNFAGVSYDVTLFDSNQIWHKELFPTIVKLNHILQNLNSIDPQDVNALQELSHQLHHMWHGNFKSKSTQFRGQNFLKGLLSDVPHPVNEFIIIKDGEYKHSKLTIIEDGQHRFIGR